MLAPGKQLQLIEKAGRKASRLAIYAANAAGDGKARPCIEPLPHDRRFNEAGWRGWPYNLIYQSFLLDQQWWHNATTILTVSRGGARQLFHSSADNCST